MYSQQDYSDFDLQNDLYSEHVDFDDYHSYEDENFSDVWNYCGLLSVQSIIPLLKKLVLLNVLFGLLVSYCKLSEVSFHLLSGFIGICLASEVQSSIGRGIILTYVFISYLILWSSQHIKPKYRKGIGTFMKFGLMGSLIISEHMLIDQELFLQIRGILMVLVMKVLFLIDETVERNRRLGIIQYFGYILCGSNIMFGPWTTYQEYVELYSKHRKKDIFWVVGICKSLTLSIVCLTVSNCWASYLIPNKSNRWLLAYRDALSFRYSHYFVSFIAEASMLAAGYSNSKRESKIWAYTIVSPLEVEIPKSLSVVVTKWNGPMHLFLKKSIYQPMMGRHGRFVAIMATFLVSSFLHGLEVRVSVVLISLGVFSYLEVKARRSVSDALDACLNIKPCKRCKHKYQRGHWMVKALLLVYTFISIIHLAYLGILMEGTSTDLNIYEKWNNLYFLGHILMVFNLILIM